MREGDRFLLETVGEVWHVDVSFYVNKIAARGQVFLHIVKVFVYFFNICTLQRPAHGTVPSLAGGNPTLRLTEFPVGWRGAGFELGNCIAVRRCH